MPDFNSLPPRHHLTGPRRIPTEDALERLRSYLAESREKPYLHPDSKLTESGLQLGSSPATGGIIMHQLRRVEAGLSGQDLGALPEEFRTGAAEGAAAEEGDWAKGIKMHIGQLLEDSYPPGVDATLEALMAEASAGEARQGGELGSDAEMEHGMELRNPDWYEETYQGQLRKQGGRFIEDEVDDRSNLVGEVSHTPEIQDTSQKRPREGIEDHSDKGARKRARKEKRRAEKQDKASQLSQERSGSLTVAEDSGAAANGIIRTFHQDSEAEVMAASSVKSILKKPRSAKDQDECSPNEKRGSSQEMPLTPSLTKKVVISTPSHDYRQSSSPESSRKASSKVPTTSSAESNDDSLWENEFATHPEVSFTKQRGETKEERKARKRMARKTEKEARKQNINTGAGEADVADVEHIQEGLLQNESSFPDAVSINSKDGNVNREVETKEQRKARKRAKKEAKEAAKREMLQQEEEQAADERQFEDREREAARWQRESAEKEKRETIRRQQEQYEEGKREGEMKKVEGRDLEEQEASKLEKKQRKDDKGEAKRRAAEMLEEEKRKVEKLEEEERRGADLQKQTASAADGGSRSDKPQQMTQKERLARKQTKKERREVKQRQLETLDTSEVREDVITGGANQIANSSAEITENVQMHTAIGDVKNMSGGEQKPKPGKKPKVKPAEAISSDQQNQMKRASNSEEKTSSDIAPELKPGKQKSKKTSAEAKESMPKATLKPKLAESGPFEMPGVLQNTEGGVSANAKPPGKKRGRPPKVRETSSIDQNLAGIATSTQEPPKKKRGRPPKVKETANADQIPVSVASSTPDPPKRKRGRPPSSEPKIMRNEDGERLYPDGHGGWVTREVKWGYT